MLLNTWGKLNSWIETVVEEVEEVIGGGGSWSKKPRLYKKPIDWISLFNEKKIQIEPIPLSETSTSYELEIDRFGQARQEIREHLEFLAKELALVKEQEGLEAELRMEFLLRDKAEAIKFQYDILEQIIVLRNIRKKRLDEEYIVLLIACSY